MFKELFAEAMTGRYKGIEYEFKRGFVYVYGERTGKPIIREKAPKGSTIKFAEDLIDAYLAKRN